MGKKNTENIQEAASYSEPGCMISSQVTPTNGRLNEMINTERKKCLPFKSFPTSVCMHD